jgi:uncharacterized protein YjbJ (UPF0337 family)
MPGQPLARLFVPRRLLFIRWNGTFSAKRRFPKANSQNRKANIMDKDRIEGSANQAAGKVKETAGKLTGDAKLQAEGNSEKVAGKVQNVVGGIKDTIKETAKSNS